MNRDRLLKKNKVKLLISILSISQSVVFYHLSSDSGYVLFEFFNEIVIISWELLNLKNPGPRFISLSVDRRETETAAWSVDTGIILHQRNVICSGFLDGAK